MINGCETEVFLRAYEYREDPDRCLSYLNQFLIESVAPMNFLKTRQ